MKQLQADWQTLTDEIFPRTKGGGWVTKLQEEADEFFAEPSAEEAADVIVVLMGWANEYGVDLEDAVRAKMEKNRKRTWVFDEERRVYKHVKQ